jgi:hypothetical protein
MSKDSEKEWTGKVLGQKVLYKFISLNHNDKYRKLFIIVCLIHLIILSLPEYMTNFPIVLNNRIEYILDLIYKLFPLPTFYIGNGYQIIFSRFLCKLFEITAQIMYVFDLLPKVLSWKQSILWRGVNFIIMILILFQIPLTLNLST